MQKLLSIEEVMKITGKAKPTIYRRTAEGTFPIPVEVPSTALRGPKTKKMWDEKDIMAWKREMKFVPKKENIVLDNGENIGRQEQNHEQVNPFSNNPWTNLLEEPKWYVKHKLLVRAVVTAIVAGAAAAIVSSVVG